MQGGGRVPGSQRAGHSSRHPRLDVAGVGWISVRQASRLHGVVWCCGRRCVWVKLEELTFDMGWLPGDGEVTQAGNGKKPRCPLRRPGHPVTMAPGGTHLGGTLTGRVPPVFTSTREAPPSFPTVRPPLRCPNPGIGSGCSVKAPHGCVLLWRRLGLCSAGGQMAVNWPCL